MVLDINNVIIIFVGSISPSLCFFDYFFSCRFPLIFASFLDDFGMTFPDVFLLLKNSVFEEAQSDASSFSLIPTKKKEGAGDWEFMSNNSLKD